MMFLYFKFYFILSVSLPFDTFDLYQGISIISVKEINNISIPCIVSFDFDEVMQLFGEIVVSLSNNSSLKNILSACGLFN